MSACKKWSFFYILHMISLRNIEWGPGVCKWSIFLPWTACAFENECFREHWTGYGEKNVFFWRRERGWHFWACDKIDFILFKIVKKSQKIQKNIFKFFWKSEKMSICQWFFWKTFFSDYHFHFIRIFRFSKKINSKKSQSGKSRTLKFRCVF